MSNTSMSTVPKVGYAVTATRHSCESRCHEVCCRAIHGPSRANAQTCKEVEGHHTKAPKHAHHNGSPHARVSRLSLREEVHHRKASP
eukprot:1663472-Pleurochrysis_carterae.AAC.5